MASLLATLSLCALVAQTGQPAAAVDEAILARIRAGLRAPTLTIPVIDDRSLRYRVLVEGRHLRLKVPWDASGETSVPVYVRPSYVEPHYEFLRMVTPEEYRAGVLYPGADMLAPAGGLIKAIKQSSRNRQIAAIRRQIAEELRQIQEANGTRQ